MQHTHKRQKQGTIHHAHLEPDLVLGKCKGSQSLWVGRLQAFLFVNPAEIKLDNFRLSPINVRCSLLKLVGGGFLNSGRIMLLGSAVAGCTSLLGSGLVLFGSDLNGCSSHLMLLDSSLGGCAGCTSLLGSGFVLLGNDLDKCSTYLMLMDSVGCTILMKSGLVLLGSNLDRLCLNLMLLGNGLGGCATLKVFGTVVCKHALMTTRFSLIFSPNVCLFLDFTIV